MLLLKREVGGRLRVEYHWGSRSDPVCSGSELVSLRCREVSQEVRTGASVLDMAERLLDLLFRVTWESKTNCSPV